MAENEWSRKIRSAFAAWSTISSVSGTIVTAYKFLSAHGQLVPTGAENVGPLTVVVNACLLTWILFMSGLCMGVLFYYLVRKGTLLSALFQLACLLVFGVSILSCHNAALGFRPLGFICLVLAVLRLSPMARLVEKNDWQTVVVAGFVLLVVSSVLGYVQTLWKYLVCFDVLEYLRGSVMSSSACAQAETFSMVPLSSMNLGLWFMACMGALLYTSGYFVFQEWRKTGG